MMLLNKRSLSVFLLFFFFSACSSVSNTQKESPGSESETTETETEEKKPEKELKKEKSESSKKETKEEEETKEVEKTEKDEEAEETSDKEEKKVCFFGSAPKKVPASASDINKEAQSKSIEEELEILNKRLEEKSRRIETLEEKIWGLNKRLAFLKNFYEEGEKNLKTMEQQSNRNIEQLREKILSISREIRELDSKYARRFDMWGAHEIAKDKKIYEEAQKLYRSGNYVDAVIMFKKYIGFFPQSSLADNAQYWIGEGYYSQHDYGRAAEEFGKVADFKDKSKLPDALLRRGHCYLHLKKYAKARELFSRIINEYSGDKKEYAIVDSAKRKLKEIKGKK